MALDNCSIVPVGSFYRGFENTLTKNKNKTIFSFGILRLFDFSFKKIKLDFRRTT